MTDQPQTDQQPESDFPEGWRPNPGDRLVGTVIDIATGDGGYGVYPIVTLNTAQGERAVHAFHTVLRTELARRRPKIGDDLDILYHGKRQNQSGKGANSGTYHSYRVRGGQSQGYDWDRDLPEEDRSDSFKSDIPNDTPDLPSEPTAVNVPSRPSETGPADDADLPF